MKTINKIVIMLALFVTTSNAIAANEVNVKTLFALLPSDAFRFCLRTNADLEKYIKVCDLKNGYLELEFEDESSWEMCYWNLKDGNKLIAITRVGAYSFYLYSNLEK